GKATLAGRIAGARTPRTDGGVDRLVRRGARRSRPRRPRGFHPRRTSEVPMPRTTARRAARACAHAVLSLALAVGLASCATVNASSPQYGGAPRFPPTDPTRVAILRSEPTRPHVRLGEIVVDASVDPAPSVEQVEQKLKIDGGQLGADAVVVVVDRL